MDLIERDLVERKAELRKLAIATQKLEDAAALPPGRRGSDETADLGAMHRRIELLRFIIQDLEETLADHRRHRRDRERNLPMTPPDTSRRRALSDRERRRIAADYRRKILAQLHMFGREVDPSLLRVHVERVTDLRGLPICDYSIETPDND